jgi:hypothetical protein
LGKPVSYEDFLAILRDAGWTKRDFRRSRLMGTLSSLGPAFSPAVRPGRGAMPGVEIDFPGDREADGKPELADAAGDLRNLRLGSGAGNFPSATHHEALRRRAIVLGGSVGRLARGSASSLEMLRDEGFLAS